MLVLQIWMCINKDLKPVDCTDEPHPHSNNYCKTVKIPPLRRGRNQEVEGNDSKVRLRLVIVGGRENEQGFVKERRGKGRGREVEARRGPGQGKGGGM